jgi:hypothetical protein
MATTPPKGAYSARMAQLRAAKNGSRDERHVTTDGRAAAPRRTSVDGRAASIRRGRSVVAVGSVLAVIGLGACGGGGSPLSNGSTSPSASAPSSSQPSSTVPSSTVPSSTQPSVTPPPATVAPTTSVTSGAPTPSAADPYGRTSSGIPLPPPNTDDVDRARVTAAPTLGPFAISASAGPQGWPDACTLTSAAQLHVIDPQITAYAGAPAGMKATIIGGSGGQSPHNAVCKYNLETTFSPTDEGNLHSFVEIELTEIDSLAASVWRQGKKDQADTQRKYPAEYALYSDLPGGASCYYDGVQLSCLKGDIAYAVFGMKLTEDDTGGADGIHWLNEAVIPLAEKLSEELVSKP